ncbi:MAG: thioredoxin TrxC [Epsilonproteobacteria bacterium]|nr:thioredoxin TrxC [Campylobacterota bacterium]
MEKINIVCPHCHKTNSLPKKESYTKANCGHCKQSLLDTKPVELDLSNFDHFLQNNDIPVVVDFWAPWCGPCRMMAPTFESVAKKFPLKIRFAKVNTENFGQISNKYGISGIPTMILFKNAKEVKRISGALDASSMTNWLIG